MSINKHGGGEVYSVSVPAAGAMIVERNVLIKYIRISNVSDVPVFVALNTPADGKCPAAVNSGIFLNGKDYVNSFVEFNISNIPICQIWGIVSGQSAATVSVQLGQ